MRLMEPHHPAEVAKRRAVLEAAEKHHAGLPANREAAFEAWLAATPNLAISPALARYPLVLPLLAWGYHTQPARWLEACATWHRAGIAIANPADVLA